MPLKTCPEGLDFFVNEFAEKHLEYDAKTGKVWRFWERRRGWLDEKKEIGKLTPNGYLMLRGMVNGKTHYVMLHRAIWKVCTGSLDEELTINHKNGIKTDNRLQNLEAVSLAENIKHAWETGLCNPARGLASGRGKLSSQDIVKIRELGASGEYLQREIAAFFGVRPNHISRILSGNRRGDDR